MPKALETGLKSDVMPVQRMAGLGAAPKIDESGAGQGPVGTDLLAELKVAAPTNIIGASVASTIHPLEKVWHPDLAAVLPPQQPFDKVGVSVEGTFDGTSLKAALSADPDGDGPIQTLPLSLWQDQMTGEVYIDIVEVELERELVRPAPGSGTPVGTKVTISGMPGRFDVKKFWSEAVHSRGDVRPAVHQVRSLAEQVQRPPYYALIAGQPWDEPKEMRDRWAEGEGAGNVDRLKGQLASAQTQLKAAEDELAKLPPPGPTGASPKNTAPPPPQGRGNRGGGRGPAPGPDSRQPNPTKSQDPTSIRLNALNKVSRAKSLVTRIEHQLAKLGVDVAKPANPDQPEAAAPVLTLYENQEVKLWEHDMTAEPGAAYRYRMRVVVNNPLFGAGVVDAQKPLAANSLVYGEYSDWSEPVEVEALSDFFIISASQANPPATLQPTSNAKLFRFYYGQWHQANVGVTPGDIFAAEIKVPPFPLYDLSKLAALFPEDRGIPGAAPGQAPAQQVDPRGRPGGRPGQMAPPTPVPAPPGAPAAGADKIAAIPGAPSTPGPTSLSAGVASMFLDAQELIMPGTDLSHQQRTETAAILRDGNGKVVARSPEADRASNAYKRIQAYLKAQESAKAPPIQANPGAAPPGAPTQPDRPDRTPPGGGGGAGGG
jgi:hypothetical protein